VHGQCDAKPTVTTYI